MDFLVSAIIGGVYIVEESSYLGEDFCRFVDDPESREV
jgi:hypothetical protein